MRYIIGLVGVVLFLAACGGSAVDDTVTDAVVTPATDTPVESPFETRLGIASDPGRRQAQLLALQRQADADLVQCMRNQGFFYVVGASEDTLRGGAYLSDGTRQWVETNGLGITITLIDALADEARTSAPDAAATNLGYVESLTPEQAADYDIALVGEGPLDPNTSEYVPAGCWGAAFGDIFERLAIVDAFGVELDELNARLASDPRVRGFDETWSLCMQEAGYRYATSAALVDEIYARLLGIELVEVDGVTSFAAVGAADELLAFERQVGLVSYDCQQSFTAEMDQLRHDYEREFLDDNRFRLADLQE